MQLSMFSLEEHPANLSQSLDCEREWMIRVATWPSPILLLLTDTGLSGLSGKTCPVSCQATEDGTLVPLSGRWANSGMGGPIESWTLNTSEWPNDAAVCSLSDVLETGELPQRYFLSPRACAGILRRAEKRGKSLPPALRQALEAVAHTPSKCGGGVEREDGSRGSQNIGKQAGKGYLGSEELAFTVASSPDQWLFQQQAIAARMVAFGEYVEDGTASAMKARDYKDATDLVAQPIAIQDVRGVEKAQNGKGWNADGTAYTVDTHATQGVAQPIGFNTRQDPDAWQGRTGPVDTHYGTQGVMQPVAIGLDEEQNARIDGFGTLKARMEGGGFEGSVMTPAMQVRRLTPTECERLQGFPDGWTNIPWRGKLESPDGPRYKALGNSMAVPVMRWIGQRVQSLKETDHG